MCFLIILIFLLIFKKIWYRFLYFAIYYYIHIFVNNIALNFYFIFNSWEQLSIGLWFLVAVVLWLTRDLHFVPGWQALFQKGYITDTTTAIFVLFCLVAWPRKNIFKGERYTPLIVWSDVEKMFPWNAILLLGGSLAMAAGCEVKLNHYSFKNPNFNFFSIKASGLSEWIGKVLENVLPADVYLDIIIMMIVSSIGTEVNAIKVKE